MRACIHDVGRVETRPFHTHIIRTCMLAVGRVQVVAAAMAAIAAVATATEARAAAAAATAAATSAVNNGVSA